MRKVDGIHGWGLQVEDSLAGTLTAVSPPEGCTNRTCHHVSHDPAAPVYRWSPDEGDLYELGTETYPDAEYTYYLWRLPEVERYLERMSEPNYWAFLHEIAPHEVPEWLHSPASTGED